MFRIEMLPAANGDCLWVEYGSVDSVHRILVDGGLASTYRYLRSRILALPKDKRVFDLLIVTHIDNDHIEGLIPLLLDTDLGCVFGDIWYNGWKHLADLPEVPDADDVLGATEGEFLGVLIEDQGLPWNRAFGGGRIMVDGDGALPTVALDGGLKLTLLSPTRRRLVKLRRTWRRVIEDADFIAGDRDSIRAQLQRRRYLPTPAGMLGDDDLLGEGGRPGRDNRDANGSSIAVLVEHDGVRALLTGDAHAPVLEAGLSRFGATVERPIQIDLWKLAHHGSWQNFTPELLQLIWTPRYLVSTNGRTFQHPDRQTIDFIVANHPLRGKPELVFNYGSPTTERWALPLKGGTTDFMATYPSGAVVLV